MAGGKVNANVVVFDEVTGESHFIQKGTVPAEHLRDKLGDHLFVDEEEAQSDIPPRSGRGSGKDAWVAYADGKVEVTDDMTRDDIIDALEAADFPVDAE